MTMSRKSYSGIFPPHREMKTMDEKPENKPNTTIDNSTPAPTEKAAVEGELSEQELSKATGGTGQTFLKIDLKSVFVTTIP